MQQFGLKPTTSEEFLILNIENLRIVTLKGKYKEYRNYLQNKYGNDFIYLSDEDINKIKGDEGKEKIKTAFKTLQAFHNKKIEEAKVLSVIPEIDESIYISHSKQKVEVKNKLLPIITNTEVGKEVDYPISTSQKLNLIKKPSGNQARKIPTKYSNINTPISNSTEQGQKFTIPYVAPTKPLPPLPVKKKLDLEEYKNLTRAELENMTEEKVKGWVINYAEALRDINTRMKHNVDFIIRDIDSASKTKLIDAYSALQKVSAKIIKRKSTKKGSIKINPRDLKIAFNDEVSQSKDTGDLNDFTYVSKMNEYIKLDINTISEENIKDVVIGYNIAFEKIYGYKTVDSGGEGDNNKINSLNFEELKKAFKYLQNKDALERYMDLPLDDNVDLKEKLQKYIGALVEECDIDNIELKDSMTHKELVNLFADLQCRHKLSVYEMLDISEMGEEYKDSFVKNILEYQEALYKRFGKFRTLISSDVESSSFKELQTLFRDLQDIHAKLVKDSKLKEEQLQNVNYNSDDPNVAMRDSLLETYSKCELNNSSPITNNRGAAKEFSEKIKEKYPKSESPLLDINVDSMNFNDLKDHFAKLKELFKLLEENVGKTNNKSNVTEENSITSDDDSVEINNKPKEGDMINNEIKNNTNNENEGHKDGSFIVIGEDESSGNKEKNDTEGKEEVSHIETGTIDYVVDNYKGSNNNTTGDSIGHYLPPQLGQNNNSLDIIPQGDKKDVAKQQGEGYTEDPNNLIDSGIINMININKKEFDLLKESKAKAEDENKKLVAQIDSLLETQDKINKEREIKRKDSETNLQMWINENNLLKGNVANLTKQVADLKTEKDEAVKTNKELESKIKDSEKSETYKTKITSLKEKLEKFDEFKNDNDYLKDQITQKDTLVSTITENAKRKDEQLQEVKELSEQKDQTIESLKKQLQVALSESSAKVNKQDLDDKDKKIKDLETSISNLEQTKQDLENKDKDIEELTMENQKTQEEFGKFKLEVLEEFKKKEAELNGLKKKYDDRTEAINNWQFKVNELQDLKNEADKENLKLKEKNTNFKKENDELKQFKNKLEEETKGLKDQIALLSKGDKEEVAKQLTEKDNEISKLKTDIQKSEEDFVALQKSKDEADRKNNELQKNFDELNKKYEVRINSTEDSKEVATKLAEKDKEILTLRNKLKQNEVDVQQKDKVIQDLTEQNKAKDSLNDKPKSTATTVYSKWPFVFVGAAGFVPYLFCRHLIPADHIAAFMAQKLAKPVSEQAVRIALDVSVLLTLLGLTAVVVCIIGKVAPTVFERTETIANDLDKNNKQKEEVQI